MGMQFIVFVFFLSLMGLTACSGVGHKADITPPRYGSAFFKSPPQQVTYGGLRSGEAYFNAAGTHMVFQSERESGNPFFQIYLKDLRTLKTQRVSSGKGKSTCAWVHPKNAQRVLFSSTHAAPNTQSEVQKEQRARAQGGRRYSWDYDPYYDIYEARRTQSGAWRYKPLAPAFGYDAESSYSPDGRFIAFASNRHAYGQGKKPPLPEESAHEMEIYIMRSNGTGLKRLTHSKGYDGGPFFSPDGQRIVWRRFDLSGARAEIFSMDLNGGDQHQLTQMEVMSWAPFYHASGKYVAFASNAQGFHNFELYMVDAWGKRDPVRVSYLPGFDAMPVFDPSGEYLYWTRKADSAGQGSQVFRAQWEHQKALKALGLQEDGVANRVVQARAQDYGEGVDFLKHWVQYLASPELKGRATGSEAERLYSQKVAGFFKSLSLEPVGDRYTQGFSFVKGARLGAGANNFKAVLKKNKTRRYVLGKDWRPMGAGQSGATISHNIEQLFFAGFGLRVPGERPGTWLHDSYKSKLPANAWVVLVQGAPMGKTPEENSLLMRHANLNHKVATAKSMGAAGVIVLSDSRDFIKLSYLEQNRGSAGTVPVVLLRAPLARTWVQKGSLKAWRKDPATKVQLGGVKLSLEMSTEQKKGRAVNTWGLIQAPFDTADTLVIGAHSDHLGVGLSPMSRAGAVARGRAKKNPIHFGADDNASGVSVVLALARFFAQPAVRSKLQKNLLFVLFSGEELGTLGSDFFVKNPPAGLDIKAYLNFDMVGRLEGKELMVQGTASAKEWTDVIEALGPQDISLKLMPSPYVPTDARSFYMAGVPSLQFFTGAHSEYHTPYDTPDTLDYAGLLKIQQLATSLVQKLSTGGGMVLTYQKTKGSMPQKGGSSGSSRGGSFRVSLGTIPSYGGGEGAPKEGVLLEGSMPGSPAQKAGVLKGDVLVRLGPFNIANIHDFVLALQNIEPNKKIDLFVMREGKLQKLAIVPVPSVAH